MAWLTRFSGVILAGGASRRMGRPKAFIELGPDAIPLVTLVRDALAAAGAPEIFTVGGDVEALAALGIDARPDEFPGEGPLGGLVTALSLADWPVAIVLSCDLPAIDAPTVRGLLAALDADPDADAAVPVVDGHQQVLAAAYRTTSGARLRAAFAGGERSVRRALEPLRVVPVDHLDPAVFVDLDVPADVDHYDRRTGSALGGGPTAVRPGSTH